MSIPFRDADDVSELGLAGFLKIDAPSPGLFRGALFLTNARGEPVEFTYNRAETPNTFLWRQDDIRRHAVRTLVTSLLSTCSRVPLFVVCLADEVPFELFCTDIRLSVPVCRIASIAAATPHAAVEAQETIEAPGTQQAFWFPVIPADGSKERRLVSRLIASGLLLEPFERALVGLREVYSGTAGSRDAVS